MRMEARARSHKSSLIGAGLRATTVSSKLDDPFFCFVAVVAGPDILPKLVRGTSHDHSIMGFSHSPFAAERTCISGLFAQFCFKFSNPLFQGGHAFANCKDTGAVISHQPNGFGNQTDIGRSAYHG